MSLLVPFFLVGLGLLVLPFWLHRLQTDNPERESFASTMFLAASQKRVHVRKKLRHIILMILRLLLLLLLVLTFCQPIFESSEPLVITKDQRLHIIIVDTSASMMNAAIFNDAKDQAKAIINAVDGSDLIQLYQFGPNLKILEESSSIHSQSIAAVNNLQPEPVAADNGVLMAELSRLDWSKPLDYQLHIISDLQQSSLADRYADMIPDLPQAAQLTFNFYPVTRSAFTNWTVDSVHEEENGLRVTVRGFDSPQQDITVRVSIDDETQATATVSVPSDGRGSVFIPALDYKPALNAVTIELIVDDQLIADNQYFFVTDRLPAEPVLLLTSNPFSPAARYLSAAMSSIGSRQQGAGYRVEAVSLADFDHRTLQRYSWLLIDDIGSINSTLSAALNDYVESGGALFTAAGPKSASLETLPVTGQQIISNAFSLENRFYNVAQVDNSHAVLNNIDGWSELNFSEAVAVVTQEQDDVLISLDNGYPLLIEQKIGQGKIILFTSSVDNLWNNLPVKPLYVSLMTELASYLSNSESLRSQWLAGETFSLKDMNGDTGQLIDPQGKAVLALGASTISSTHLFNQLGFYHTYTAADEGLVAVNIDIAESDLSALSVQDIERWQQALRGELSGDDDSVNEKSTATLQQPLEQSSQLTSKQPLWFGFMCAVALLLLIESIFANMQLQRRAYL